MTAHSITISNSLRAFGGGPPSLWNAHNWNAFKWAEATVAVPHRVVHLVDADDLALASAFGFRLVKLMGAESLTVDSSVNFSLTRLISNEIGLSSDSVTRYVFDSEGYFRLFPGGVTDAEDQDTPAWAAGSAGSPTWTQGSASETTWSDS